jgi:hypothetical protein
MIASWRRCYDRSGPGTIHNGPNRDSRKNNATHNRGSWKHDGQCFISVHLYESRTSLPSSVPKESCRMTAFTWE